MAVISGLYTVLSKHTLKTISPWVLFWSVMVVSTPIIFLFTWQNGIPALGRAFFVGVFGSVIFYSVSKIIFYRVIKETDLSHVYPLITLSPVFSLIFAIFLLGERPTALELLAGGITLFGVYVLNISSIREGLLEPFKILAKSRMAMLMLLSVALIGAPPVFDKFAISSTFPQNTSFVLVVEDLMVVLLMFPWVWKHRTVAFPQIKENKKYLLWLGILGAFSNIAGFWALGHGEASLVTSVFRTQVFFVFLFSFLFFKDRPRAETIVGTTIMIIGLIVLKLVS